jgi:hypothetical protein
MVVMYILLHPPALIKRILPAAVAHLLPRAVQALAVMHILQTFPSTSNIGTCQTWTKQSLHF